VISDFFRLESCTSARAYELIRADNAGRKNIFIISRLSKVFDLLEAAIRLETAKISAQASNVCTAGGDVVAVLRAVS
jgi:hypothetical protein